MVATRTALGTILFVSCILCMAGCGEEPLSVRLDLCPGPGASQTELDTIRSATTWTLEVWGFENDDVPWQRSWAGLTDLSSLELAEAIPPNGQVRLLVEGYGNDLSGEYRMVAIGASSVLMLRGSEEVCLCVAPPETYEERCEIWTCSFDTRNGVCEDIR